MSTWKSQDAAAATGGKAGSEWTAQGVTIDSRLIHGGELHVAIHGERVDGHLFARDALDRGAVAVMASHVPVDVSPKNLLLVDDTLKALSRLGAAGRARALAQVVGVTGSVGKTSAKEMLKIALSAHGETFASHGNFNNHIGTPLNLANLPPEIPFAVFELGMNHAGEIRELTRIVRPHGALITAVAAAHLEFFPSVEAIADAKSEIFEGVMPGGFAVINADSEQFSRCAEHARRLGIERVIGFGGAGNAQCRLLEYRGTLEGSAVRASIHGQEITYRLKSLGVQWALLSTGVLGVAHALGLDVKKTAEALAAFEEPAGRGTLVSIPVPGGAATLVDDSYNASPVAMRAAFAKLADLRAAGACKGRVFAALGDMRELGDSAPRLHAELAEPLVEAEVDLVFTAGPLMEHLHEALPTRLRGEHCADAAALTSVVRDALRAGDVLLVKGSHGSRMYELAAALRQ